MSIIPNDKFYSADSLQLTVFGIKLEIVAAINTIDIYSRHRSFWKSAVIRNLQPIDQLLFRTRPNDTFSIVQPNAELPVKGWGSFMEVTSAAATPVGVVDFECVRLENALRRTNAK